MKNGQAVTLTQDWTSDKGKLYPAGLIGRYSKHHGREYVHFLGYYDQAIHDQSTQPSLLPVPLAQYYIAEDEQVTHWQVEQLKDANETLEERLKDEKEPYAIWTRSRIEANTLRIQTLQENHHFISMKLLALDHHFEVSTCYLHKLKLGFKIPKDMSRADLIAKLITELGDDWETLSFKTIGSITW